MKVLVTGGGGFLGGHLVKALLERGHNVTSFNRGHYPAITKIGAKEYRGDLQNYGEVKKAIKGKDVVFHVAGKVGVWGNYQEYFNINVVGTENIIRACRECGVKKLIFTSSPSVVFGKDDIENGDESLPYPQDYIFHYGKTKALAEKIVLQANDEGLATISLRPHLIFGPGDKNLFPKVVNSAREGRLKIVGEGNNLVDVIYVDNAVEAHLKAFESLEINGKTSGKTYFIGQEEPVRLWDLINKILESYGLKPLKKKIRLTSAYRIGALLEATYRLLGIKKDPPMTRFIAMQLGKSHYFNHGNAQRDLNFSPKIDLDTALERTLPQRNDLKQENTYAH